MSTLPRSPVFESILKHANKVAIVDSRIGTTTTYAQLLGRVLALRSTILSDGSKDLQDARVTVLCPPGLCWSVVQLAVWASGGYFVPLADRHPLEEMVRACETSQASIIVTHGSFAPRAAELANATGIERVIRVTDTDEPAGDAMPTLADCDMTRPAMMLFTSGSTGRPKGCELTHANLAAQAASISQCWGITADDHVHSILPMNHIHGTVNAVHTSLSVGASIETMSKFDAAGIWRRWQDTSKPRLTVLHAVPTIYSRLEAVYSGMEAEEQRSASAAAKAFRLMVSGSAALPTPLRKRWRELSGHTLLERLGMTECGMILSCGLDESERIDAHVGNPMPSVDCRIFDLDTNTDVTEQLDTPGELQVRGPTIFRAYYGQPDVTAREFDGSWFKTGDIVQRSSPHGSYRVLGRASMDMIKSGGEKLSALEIESAVLALPQIDEVAVVGVADDAWGAVPGAIVVLRDTCAELTLNELRDLLRPHLAAYKLPQRIHVSREPLPRNHMGKILKKPLAASIWPAKA